MSEEIIRGHLQLIEQQIGIVSRNIPEYLKQKGEFDLLEMEEEIIIPIKIAMREILQIEAAAINDKNLNERLTEAFVKLRGKNKKFFKLLKDFYGKLRTICKNYDNYLKKEIDKSDLKQLKNETEELWRRIEYLEVRFKDKIQSSDEFTPEKKKRLKKELDDYIKPIRVAEIFMSGHVADASRHSIIRELKTAINQINLVSSVSTTHLNTTVLASDINDMNNYAENRKLIYQKMLEKLKKSHLENYQKFEAGVKMNSSNLNFFIGHTYANLWEVVEDIKNTIEKAFAQRATAAA